MRWVRGVGAALVPAPMVLAPMVLAPLVFAPLALATVVLASVVLAPAPAMAGAADAPEIAVTAAHLGSRADGDEIALTLSRPVEATAFTLAGPDRVILDLPQVSFRIDPASLDPARLQPEAARGGGRHRGRRLASSLISSVRFGLLMPGRSRLVIALRGPARIESCRVGRDGAGASILMLKLARAERTDIAAGPAPPAAVTLVARASSPSGAAAAGAEPRPVIVIDPGHGGPDNGAERNGIVEKDLTLAFARALAARLEGGGRYTVVLTRTSDVFVPLSGRVAIARHADAALMISIHADTLPEASRDAAEVSGATIYTVSDRASDSYAATLAAKENAADAAAGVTGQPGAADVNDILFDLTRQETRAYSHVFARALVNYWKVVGHLNKNPQRSAGFVVLKAPDVPSVLVELGYLSSAGDAASFQSDSWRDRAAGRMAEAVDDYFARRRIDPQRRRAGLSEAALALPAAAAR